MKLLKPFAAAACAALCAFSLTACNAGKSTLLGEPQKTAPVSWEQITSDGFGQFKAKAERFAADFASYAYADKTGDNIAVSPVSVYMALSLAAECADGDTRAQILDALGVTIGQLRENFPVLYNSLTVEHKSHGKVTGVSLPSNSLWVNEGTPVKTPCIDALSEYYYAYSYSADFKNDNIAANKAVRNFVKKQTKGVIDTDFKLKEGTLFALINTLYLKTIWNDRGDDLSFTGSEYEFVNADGTKRKTKLLEGYYKSGKVYKAEKYSSFFTSTYDGYKIKFIVPNDGYSLCEVFTSENIYAVNALKDYNAVDKENKVQYFTRCLFPEFKAKYDSEIKEMLSKNFGIENLFNDPGIFPPERSCDFSNLSDDECYCGSVRHITDLTVDKKGIEGAAVTVIAMDGATSAGPEYQIIYEDFAVDKTFGFIITDSNDVTLFSGVIDKI